MRVIEKKILPKFYKGVASEHKTFEIRKDEDNAEVGDILFLREWDGEKYTGHQTKREITYILRDAEEYGLAKGYCIYGIQPRGWNSMRQTTVNQYGNNCVNIENAKDITFNL